MTHHPRSRQPYLIVPRYLAGPDPDATTTAAHVLQAAGWHTEHTPDHTDYSDPRGLRQARHLADAPDPGRLGQPLMTWEFTASPVRGGRAAWTAWFCRDTPPEFIAAFAAALADDTPAPAPGTGPHYLQPPTSPGHATAPLAAAGWTRGLGNGETAWYGPHQQAAVVTARFPSSSRRGAANWLCAARRATDLTVLWLALACLHTPTHLVAALCRAITDPTPVPRRTPPGPDTGALTITHPA
ncbi:DUF317 domain-containing protein [Streptomyces sp. NBS 14/10]|uniref:DUF317 domain-containing protein n=1 Tax=Streptomyces sp. NBS 14/10 TaxID=1945643 RepID=UPI000B7CD15F|nr:DUF317 domain-containing protein [Streptomyces sp. NBS 14/10]KAK1177973.1 DUF317 domain-containing protein [Streptomyces sp. NBS 14/10]